MAWGIQARRIALAAASVVVIAAVMTLAGRTVRPIGKVAGVLTQAFIVVAFGLIWRGMSKGEKRAVEPVEPELRSTTPDAGDHSGMR
jgi:hypothetical protein